MKRVELQIVADNSQYLKGAKEVTQATQQMEDKSKDFNKSQKTLINQTGEAYKKVAQESSKAFNTKEMDAYKSKTKETADAVQGVGGAAGRAVGGVRSLGATFKALMGIPIVAAISAAIAIFAGLIKIFKTSDKGAAEIQARFAQLKAIIDVLRQRILTFTTAIGNIFKGNWKEAGEGMKASFSGIGDELRATTEATYKYTLALADIERAEKNYVSTAAENKRKIAELEYNASDRTKSTSERKKALKEAMSLSAQEVQVEKDRALERLNIGISQLVAGKNVSDAELLSFIKMNDEERKIADKALQDFFNLNKDKVNDLDQMYATWIDLGTKYFEEEKRNMTRLSGFEVELNRDITEKRKKAEEERLKNLKEFTDASLKLQQEYEKSLIDGMTGEEKIQAEKEYQLKQIDQLQAYLASLGTLTEDHYKYLDGLRAKAIKDAEIATRQEQQATLDYWRQTYDAAINHRLDFYDYREQLDLKTAELAGELTGKKELEIQAKWLKARIDLLKASKDPILQQQAEILDAELALINKQAEGTGTSLWEMIGLGDNDELQRALKDGVQAAVDALDEIFEARVADAQRTRELLDTQISETQRSLDAEVELAKLGYANNIDAKRKEIEDLKVAREKALKEEEKALKAKQAIDTATQVSSLLTASAQIIMGLTKATPLIGLVLSVAAIAAMWGMFAAAKVKAAQATKLAEGGVGTETGMITGRSHAQGGEPFLKHVEVERGEMFGVLNRNASRKYGRAFTEVVNNFNRDNLVIERPDTMNNITVDVNQTNERLDKVEYQLIKLNTHFGGKREVHETPYVRIEKIGPHKTRIIRK